MRPLSIKRLWPFAAASFAVYVSCYFILLTPKPYRLIDRADIAQATGEARPGVRWYPPPNCHDGILPILFTPIFYLDKSIRPSFWEKKNGDPAPEWFFLEE